MAMAMTMQLKLFFGRLRRRSEREEEEMMTEPPTISSCEHSTTSCERSVATSSTCSTVLSSSSILQRIDSSDAIKSEGTTSDCPSCWLCLEEGSDTSGKPLIRNCSCRGTSGYAHISCIVHYAEHKGRQGYGSSNHNFNNVCRYFKFCPNCNQEYQNDVQCDLSKAMVSFVERKLHDGTPRASYLRIVALVDRLFVLSAGSNNAGTSEGQVICSKLMFLMDGMDSVMKARTYYALGCFYSSSGSLKKSKAYLETARNLLQDADDDSDSSVRDIADIEIKLNCSSASSDVDSLQSRYEETFAKSGRETTLTIDAGVALAKALHSSDRHIEAEKLLANLIATSRRVHGQDHHCTKSAATALQGLTNELLEDPSSTDSEFGDIDGWFKSI
mmetsp:Transcript_24833/g.49651  ORF Transcript_24833/g.49651 Transcript_24833/m.49651 type:complete len:387 (+) Transcript_24833:115-1275(+)